MSCSLDKGKIYKVDSIKYDYASDRYIVNIDHPPESCQQAQFAGSAIVTVNNKLVFPILSYNIKQSKPEIFVNNSDVIQIINQPIKYPFLWLILALIIGGLFSLFIKKLIDNIEKKLQQKENNKFKNSGNFHNTGDGKVIVRKKLMDIPLPNYDHPPHQKNNLND